MIEITPAAKEQIDTYFADKPVSPIRIFLAGGCGGPRLALALDDAKDNDEKVQASGYTFVVEKDLFAKAQPLTVDMTPFGFAVKSEMELPSGGGCSGCTSCG